MTLLPTPDHADVNLRYLQFMRAGKPVTVGLREYEAFCLYRFKGKTMREIADMLHVSMDRVDTMITQAEWRGAQEFQRGVCPRCHGTGIRPEGV